MTYFCNNISNFVKMYQIKYIHRTILVSNVQNNKPICDCECIEVERTDISKDKGIYITYIFTHTEFRNKGYASDMLNFMINFCKTKNYKYIILDDSTEASPPHNLYYKLNCLVKKFDKDNNYIWVKWRDNIDLSVDEERLFKF